MKIKILPKEVIKKIAAGEVVENPASVLKELIENSIDAKADLIEIKIKNAGLETIEIKDNGEGIEPDDIPKVVYRYATSKISKIEDLKYKITLGFRGEALYAISQVSKLTIISSTDKIEDGFKAMFIAGKLKDYKPHPHPKGTTVKVEDLFFNYPVRKIFLSSKKRIKQNLLNLIISYVLNYPKIEFKIEIDGEIYNFPKKENYKERIKQIYPDEIFIEFEKKEEKIEAKFFISPQEKLKLYPNCQHIFINGREVKENKIKEAIYKAYGTYERHPSFIIFLKINPLFVDFNIHPQKKEVKISPILKIYSKIEEWIEEKLMEGRTYLEYVKINDFSKKIINRNMEQLEITKWALPSLKKTKEKRKDKTDISFKIFQILGRYIIFEVSDGFFIIEQHGAHERILYEKILKNKTSSQKLLFPFVYSFTPSKFEKFKEVKEKLENYGFKFRTAGKRDIIIEAIPSIFKNLSKEEFEKLIEEILEYHGDIRFEAELPKIIACKAAIKEGEKLTEEEMRNIVKELFSCKYPHICPHGRPVIYKITQEELEKIFKNV